MRVNRSTARRLVFMYKFWGKLKNKIKEIQNMDSKKRQETREFIARQLSLTSK